MCSVFSEKAFDILIKLGVRNIKIPSGEVNNLPLLEHISKRKKIKIFLSTGMSSWKEINKAVKILKKNKLILMQCTSMYPCPDNYVGLNVLNEMKKRFDAVNKKVVAIGNQMKHNEYNWYLDVNAEENKRID